MTGTVTGTLKASAGILRFGPESNSANCQVTSRIERSTYSLSDNNVNIYDVVAVLDSGNTMNIQAGATPLAVRADRVKNIMDRYSSASVSPGYSGIIMPTDTQISVSVPVTEVDMWTHYWSNSMVFSEYLKYKPLNDQGALSLTLTDLTMDVY